MTYRTPLRYPGGKARLSGYIKNIIKLNKLTGKNYIEPFAGGAGVALELLFSNVVDKIYLNDINIAVYSFWRSVLEKNDLFCEMINDTPINIEEWEKQQEIQKKDNKKDYLKLGFSTFFLNRTNRSGIIKAGVIGGKSQSGIWKLDARFNKVDLIKRIKNIGQLSSKINLNRQDAGEFINSLSKNIRQESLLYLDPPYYVKGKGLYEHHFQDEDHIELYKKLLNAEYPYWLVSYDSADFIIRLYKEYRSILYNLNYSAQNRTIGKEVMFFSNSVIIPNFTMNKSIKKHRLPNDGIFQAKVA